MPFPKYLSNTDNLTKLRPLPVGLDWYSVGGQCLYPVYGPSGCLMATLVAILVADLDNEWSGDFGGEGLHYGEHGTWYVIHFNAMDTRAFARRRISHAINEIESAMRFKYEVSNGL